MSPTSRINRRRERQSKRQLIIFSSVLVVLLFVMLTYGARVIEFIGNTTFLIRGEEPAENPQNNFSILHPPVLDSIEDATSENTVHVSGSVADAGGTIKLYVNNGLQEEIEVEDDEFEIRVPLEAGMNEIKTRFVKDGHESKFSNVLTILYSNEAPEIEISFPDNGAEFKKGDQQIEVRGITDPENTVTVNGFRAVVDRSGSFSYYLGLSEGENTIEVVARNKAGIETSKEVTVTFSE